MTKRSSAFDQQTNKKRKLEEDIEALWGDDFDAEALEECINLATQVYQQEKVTCTQVSNVSILPSYSAFKGRTAVISSTQLTQVNSSIRPSTSKHELIPKKVTATDLANDLNVLQERYKEKEGEVSILRAQLHETKTNTKIEQQKLQNEWKQKITQTERQMKSVKSELEFKNLEIANLKQKILEITKHNILDTSAIAGPSIRSIPKPEKVVADNASKRSAVLQPVVDPIYPLKDIEPEAVFKGPRREHHITETKFTNSCRNAIPYLQNQLTSTNVVVDRSVVDISCVYSNILSLIRCTEAELNDENNLHHISKIVCACEQFLFDLIIFLNQIKENLRTENILEADSNYLSCQDKISEIESCGTGTDEIGVKASVLLNFIAQALPYNEYLRKYVCRGEDLHLQDTLRKQFPHQNMKEQSEHKFLNMILNITRISGEIRKASYMTKFFMSTIKLLISINKSKNYSSVSDIFCKITKEIILSRPSVKAIHQITVLFKVASQHSSFIEFLLNKSENSNLSKKGVLYFNEDACRFYIFVLLFDNCIFGQQFENFPLNVCLNLLCFMYNTFKNCHWIHHRNTKDCECIIQLYKLEIEIVSKALEMYIDETKNKKLLSSKWTHFFKNPIVVKVLNLMVFNAYELTEKYITVFSQYKQIEKTLQEDDDLLELERLNITDEVTEISSDAFSKANF